MTQFTNIVSVKKTDGIGKSSGTSAIAAALIEKGGIDSSSTIVTARQASSVVSASRPLQNEHEPQSNSYSASEFWEVFFSDLRNAKAHVIIHSSFISLRQVKALVKELGNLTKRGVTVCIFLQEPRYKTPQSEDQRLDLAVQQGEFELSISILQQISVHLNLLKDVHIKFAVIDDAVFWEGSLNIMSYYNTQEHMRRWGSKKELDSMRKKYKLDACQQCAANTSAFLMDEENMLNFGEFILSIRSKSSFSQKGLAKKCSVTQSRISHLEAGANITLRCASKILRGLGLRIMLVPEIFVQPVSAFIQRLANRSEK